MFIVYLPCHLVSCNAVTARVYLFNWESRDNSAPVLNNVRTFHVPKISSFSLQPGRRLFVKPVQGISEVSWTQILFRGRVVTPMPNPQPGVPGCPFWSGSSSPLTCLAWVPPANSRATAGLAVRIIWPHKPHHYHKVGTPSGGLLYISWLFCLWSKFMLFVHGHCPWIYSGVMN